MSFPTTNLHTGDRWSEGYKNYEWNGSSWEENEICIPEHHWKFNEVSSQIYVSDSGSIPKHLYESGTNQTLGNSGHINKSCHIGNTNGDSYRSTSAEAATLYGCTIFTWFKASSEDNRVLYGRWQGSGIYLHMYGSSPTTIRIAFGSEGENFSLGSINLYDSNWHHVGGRARSNGTNMLFELFIDGEFINSSVADPTTTLTYTQTTSLTTDGQHYVGNFRYNDSNHPANCELEDVRVYHRAISDLDIANIYNYGLGTHSQFNVPGYPTVKYPVHHWKLDEDGLESSLRISDSGKSPILLDETGDITQSNAVIIDGKRSYFNVSDEYFSHNFISSELYSAWTISFRFKADISAGELYALYLAVGNSSKLIRIYMSTTAISVNMNSWTGLVIHNYTTNTDYYITITYDGNELRMYSELTLWDSLDSIDTDNKTQSYTSSDAIRIGASSTFSGSGYVDDVKMWDYCLSTNERENEFYLGKDQGKTL